jgi:hypothetical protein
MAIDVRIQMSFQFDSSFPRDAVTINPSYLTGDPAALLNVLKTNLIAGIPNGANTPFVLKAYNHKTPPPSYPLSTVTNGTGFLTTAYPRELALCLSFYAGQNRPGQRGRVYLPVQFLGSTTQLRPNSTQMTNAMQFAQQVLNHNLPSGDVWCVYSRAHATSLPISDYWVDNEWDIIRSRGLRGDQRQTAVTP